MSEHAAQFDERDEREKEEGEQGNRESGSGPGNPDSQGQPIQDQPGTTEDPSAD